MKVRRKKNKNCRPTFKISMAGHLLKQKHSSTAASILSRNGKADKKRRKRKGCLNGDENAFQLTEKQKEKLPMGLQKAIVAYHRSLGKIILRTRS